MKRFVFLLLGLGLFICSKSQYSYSTAGSVYSQDFDGLPATGNYGTFTFSGNGPFNLNASPVNATNVDGWQFYKTGGSAANAVFYAGTGSNNNSGVLSLGQLGATNRALGSLPSSGGTYAIGFLITNNTGSTLSSFTVGFTVEQWRNGGSNIANTWSFKYKYGPSMANINQVALTANSNLNFSSIISSGSSSALDGTISANKNYKSFTVSGITWNNGDQLLLRWDDATHSNSDAMAIDNFSFAAYPSTNVYRWAGGSSGSYQVASNWSPNRNSSSPNDILVFNAGGTTTVDNVQSETIKDVVISNGSAITLQNSSVASALTISDHLNICAGTIVNAGTNCTMQIGANGSLNLNGTFNTNNSCLLQSDNTGTASIGISTGTINGNASVEKFIPAQRAYRLLGHPFNNNIALSSLLNSVDISGAAGNGFTNNAGTNPSAFSFINTANNWQAFSNTSSTWNAGQGLLLFIRGKNNEGLTGPHAGADAYITGGPSDMKISLSGILNIGDVPFTTASSSTWNLVANPYAAPIDITQVNNLITVAGGSNSFVYLWDPYAQKTFKAVTSGAYLAKQLNSSIVIPSFSSFFVKNTTGAAMTLIFSESNKTVSAAPLVLLGMNDNVDQIKLSIENDNQKWDELLFQFYDSAHVTSSDINDLEKFGNSNFNFYSISSDEKKLAVDTRPVPSFANNKIMLGMNSSIHSSFTIKVEQFHLPLKTIVFLNDKFLHQNRKIDKELVYPFEITSDSLSQGDRRFEIIFQEEHLSVENDSVTNELFSISPNPAKNVIVCRSLANKTFGSFIQIVNQSGQIVKIVNTNAASDVLTIQVNDLSAGVYFIRYQSGVKYAVQKFIKE